MCEDKPVPPVPTPVAATLPPTASPTVALTAVSYMARPTRLVVYRTPTPIKAATGNLTGTPSATSRLVAYSGSIDLYASDRSDYNYDSFTDLDSFSSHSPFGYNGDLQERDIKLTIFFYPNSGFLMAVNGASIDTAKARPTKEECEGKLADLSHVNDEVKIEEGAYYCVLSTRGSVFALYVDAYSERYSVVWQLLISFDRFSPFLPTPQASPTFDTTFPLYTTDRTVLVNTKDLDSGARMLTTEDDIQFGGFISTTHNYSLQALNGAQILSVETDEPDYLNCWEAFYTVSPTWEAEVLPGNHLCLLTNQGRLSRVYISELHPSLNGELLMDFVTWDGAIIVPLPTPTPTFDPSIPIRQTGVQRLFIARISDVYMSVYPPSTRPQSYLDLDDSEFKDIEEGDIQFVGDHGMGRMAVFSAWLWAVNGAGIWEMGNSPPGFEGCQAMLGVSSDSRSGVFDFSPGDYYCVLTHEGRLSQIRIDGFDLRTLRNGEAWIQISYVTWEQVVRKP